MHKCIRISCYIYVWFVNRIRRTRRFNALVHGAIEKNVHPHNSVAAWCAVSNGLLCFAIVQGVQNVIFMTDFKSDDFRLNRNGQLSNTLETSRRIYIRVLPNNLSLFIYSFFFFFRLRTSTIFINAVLQSCDNSCS